jgi:iron(III) transport system substrate-binding protein
MIFAASALAADSKRGWQTAWQQSVELAKKEGRLVIHGSGAYEQAFKEFQKVHPEISVVTIAGRGAQRLQQVLSERRAGKYLADLFLGGIPTPYSLYKAKMLDSIKANLLLPEVLDESKWWKGRHKYVDDEGEYIFAFNEVVLPFVSYNTGLVKPSEIQSYWDLLNPKWKGKIVALDPAGGIGVDTHLVFLHSHPALGPKFLVRLLTETDLTASRDERQIVDWLAKGRYAIAVFMTPSRGDLNLAKTQGLPVDWVDPKHLKEGTGTSISNGTVALLDRAPHPNAARVAINWLLSREGQIAYQKFQFGSDSLRIDISKDQVPLFARRVVAVNYVQADNPDERSKAMEPVRKILDEVWRKK